MEIITDKCFTNFSILYCECLHAVFNKDMKMCHICLICLCLSVVVS